jgi:protein TonB
MNGVLTDLTNPEGWNPRFLRGLALSLALHLALLVVWQKEVGSQETRTLVLQSRLVMPPNNETQQMLPPESPSPEPALTQPAAETAPPQAPNPPVLAVATPSQPAPVVEKVAAAKPEPIPSPAASPLPPQIAKIPGPPMGVSQPAPLPSVPLAVDATWYPTRKVDVPAKVISGGEPEYPKLARLQNREGWVVIQVRINKLGKAEEVQVVQADPPGVFDENALAFYRQARYQPAVKDGRNVNYETRFKVTFKLDQDP